MLYRSRWRRAQVAVAERQPREQARADQAQREARRTGGFVRRRARLGTASLAVGGNASRSLADTTPPLVIAKRTTGVCDGGERGVCDEAYTLPDGKGGRRPGWSILFEKGRSDGFSPDDVELILEITGELCREVADYEFTRVLRLISDFQRGRFAPAFPPERRAMVHTATLAAGRPRRPNHPTIPRPGAFPMSLPDPNVAAERRALAARLLALAQRMEADPAAAQEQLAREAYRLRRLN